MPLMTTSQAESGYADCHLPRPKRSKVDMSATMSRYEKDFVSLPSGLRVELRGKADPKRPWEVVGSGDGCFVRRQRRGDTSAYEDFKGGRPLELMLNERDAHALVEHLNANAPMRLPRETPTGWR